MDGDAYVHLLARWVHKEGKRLAQYNPKATISISLHHLYYLLTRFDDLDVPIGPLNVRLESIDEQRDANYVSFSRRSDAASIRSVSSIRSVMTTVASWTFGFARTEEQTVVDLKQLYSAFCKIPAIKICPTKTEMVTGFEEYPFDTAVPLLAFKNLQHLELNDYSFRALHGWDEMSEQLRSLIIKRGLDDLESLTIQTIKEEQDRKRRKAERVMRHWQMDSPRIGSRSGSPRPDLSRSSSRLERKGSIERKHSCTEPFVLSPDKWHHLRYLCLADNKLIDLTPSALLPLCNLNFLDLSKNNFTSIPSALASLTHLRSLDLSHNNIETLHCLLTSPIPGISTLSLRNNKLNSIAGIERLPSLERVDFRNNELRDPQEMARLNHSPNMAEIWISGNKLTQTHSDYRITIFNLFRENTNMTEDISIDGSKPGILEKRYLIARPTTETVHAASNERIEEVITKKKVKRIVDLQSGVI